MRASEFPLQDLPPKLKSVADYWSALKGERDLPLWRDLDMTHLPSDLLPTTMVIDIRDPISESVYRYWGSELSEIHGRDMTGGRPYDLMPAEFGRQLLVDHSAVVAEKRLKAGVYAVTTRFGYQLSHMVLRLPLSDDGAIVSKLMIVADYTKDTLALLKQMDLGPDIG